MAEAVMCRCTQSIKTPFCGKPGCQWPKLPDPLLPEGLTPRDEPATVVVNVPTDTAVGLRHRARLSDPPIIVKVGKFGTKIEVPQTDWLVAFTNVGFHEGAD